MNDFPLQLLSTLLALALVLALAWVTLRLLRGRLPGGPARADGSSDALRFLRAMPVGSRERVVLIEHRGEQLLLGVAQGGVSLLARWPHGDVAPVQRAASASAIPPVGNGAPVAGDAR